MALSHANAVGRGESRLECRLVEKIVRAPNATYLGEIVETHVDEHLLKGKECADARVLDPLIWTPDGHYYRLGAVVGQEHVTGQALSVWRDEVARLMRQP
jgi:hypothetical protein